MLTSNHTKQIMVLVKKVMMMGLWNTVPSETDDTNTQVPVKILKETTLSSQTFYGSDQSETAQIDENYALDSTGLNKQLYSPALLCLWRSGACSLRFEAREDDNEFDVSSNLSYLVYNATCLLFYLHTMHRTPC